MITNKDYRPANIEFDVAHDGSLMPENFGNFENEQSVFKFLANMSAINQAITVNRHMDTKEKQMIRLDYAQVLEDKLPMLEKEQQRRMAELAEAKAKDKEATESVNAAVREARDLAHIVKKGVKEIRLDDKYTVRIPYYGKYYFYTYIDKQLKLCKISDIPESEKNEIFNVMGENNAFIDANFGEGSVFDQSSNDVTQPDFEENDNVSSPDAEPESL